MYNISMPSLAMKYRRSIYDQINADKYMSFW